MLELSRRNKKWMRRFLPIRRILNGELSPAITEEVLKMDNTDWPWPNIDQLADLKFDEMIETIVGDKLTAAEKSKLRLAFLTFANCLSYFNAQSQVDKLAEILRKSVWQFRLRGPKAPPRLRWEPDDGPDQFEPPGPRW